MHNKGLYILIQFFGTFLLLSPLFPGRANDLHERISKTAEADLFSRYEKAQSAFEVRVVRTGGDIPDRGSIELIWPERINVPRALLRVNIHSRDPLANHYTGWALLYIAHFDSVLVLNHSAKNNDPINDSDLSTIWAETTRFHGTPLTPHYYRKLKASGNVYANRFISENRILKDKDLRNAYDVETGQQVIMTYLRNGITLELSCKSRNKGYKGDTIKLFSPDTQQMYKARVLGSQKAIWIETL